jgi:Mn2+/Fe2+ NRAMP family transporter
VLNAIITPLILTNVPILTNRETVLGAAKNGSRFKGGATACVAVVGMVSFVVLVHTVFGLG